MPSSRRLADFELDHHAPSPAPSAVPSSPRSRTYLPHARPPSVRPRRGPHLRSIHRTETGAAEKEERKIDRQARVRSGVTVHRIPTSSHSSSPPSVASAPPPSSALSAPSTLRALPASRRVTVRFQVFFVSNSSFRGLFACVLSWVEILYVADNRTTPSFREGLDDGGGDLLGR